MKVSFIVSTFERPTHLLGCLTSLRLQTVQDFEIIVTDNSLNTQAIKFNIDYTNMFSLAKQYIATHLPSCYHSAEEGARIAKGEYLCFPNDDSYYVPIFLEQLLKKDADVIYCNMLYDARCGEGKYSVMKTRPEKCHIDKTGFLIKRDVFLRYGFSTKVDVGPCYADGDLIEQVHRAGHSFAKVDEVLVVHN